MNEWRKTLRQHLRLHLIILPYALFAGIMVLKFGANQHVMIGGAVVSALITELVLR